MTLEQRTQRMDQFFDSLIKKIEDFFSKHDLLPPGHRYDFATQTKRHRTAYETVVQLRKTSSHGWFESTRELPTEKEWREVLKLPGFNQKDRKSKRLKSILIEMKDNNVYGIRVHYLSWRAITKSLEEAGNVYRLDCPSYNLASLRKVR